MLALFEEIGWRGWLLHDSPVVSVDAALS